MVTISTLRPYFEGKNVLLTGHTGFKGSWLLQILSLCKANITGLALAPESPSLYEAISGDDYCNSVIQDIRDADAVRKVVVDCQPDYIFHLAAQPLVLASYANPLYTFETNAMGTAHILEGVRALKKACCVVLITTDKVYENLEQGHLFKEDDKLGGYDPYSASKAACEILISSYKRSFFNPNEYSEHQKAMVSMRAGNVIGGGDYAPNRIIPDIIRAVQQNESVQLRNPKAVRPWQHVLEPLAVYLQLAVQLHDDPTGWKDAYNVGPRITDTRTVEEVTQFALSHMKRGKYIIDASAPIRHEAGLLMLSIDAVQADLNWHPLWSAEEAIEHTIDWYVDDREASVKCAEQINLYFQNTINSFTES